MVMEPAEILESLVASLRTRGVTTGVIVRRHQLDELGQPGPRWDDDQPASLERVLIHLLQEYARYLGHLDIYTELVEGDVGE
ncbi:MAG TPA: DUF664 domain-containing protein [Acidimicrobiales bacterium]|nr:DUF664 domain-containing protein [Acidimicrobiales bacterium]